MKTILFYLTFFLKYVKTYQFLLKKISSYNFRLTVKIKSFTNYVIYLLGITDIIQNQIMKNLCCCANSNRYFPFNMIFSRTFFYAQQTII